MQNLLAKFTALGLIGGGFAATGDLGWIAERGMRVLAAADVAAPSAREEAVPTPDVGQEFGVSALPAAPAVAAPVAAQPVPVPASGLPPALPLAPAGSAPVSPAAAALPPPPPVLKPPAGGPKQVSWAGIAAGDRIVVWLAAGGARCLVLDVVDPATGEALAYEAAAVSPEGRPLMAAGPPRRVVVGRRAGESGLAVGGMISLASAGIATQGEGGRWLGPIEGLAVVD